MGLGSYTVGDNLEEFVFVDLSVNSYDLTLDPDNSVDVYIRITSVAGTNVLTIDDTNADTINGSATLVLNKAYDAVHLVYWDGEWHIASEGGNKDYRIGVVDANSYFTATELDGVLDELADGTVHDSRYEQLRTTAFFPAHLFQTAHNSPTQELAPGTLGVPCWSCATGNNEGVAALVNIGHQIPGHWTTFDVEVVWCSRGTNTGDVRWQHEFTGFSETDTLATISFGTGYVDAAPGVAYEVVYTATASGVSVPAEEYMSIHLRRNGAAGTDTLTDSASFLGILLTKAS